MATYHRRRIGMDILVPFILLALVFGGLFWQKYHEARQVPKTVQKKLAISSDRTVVLFFADHGNSLAREAREIEKCDDQTSCIRSTLEELFRGPVGNLDAVIPEWTIINDIRVNDRTVVIDLEKDFAESLPNGSSAERMAVYSIVNTVCSNFHEIQLVKINIDGNHGSRLRHLDLSEPLEPDLTYGNEQQTVKPQ